MHISFKTKTNKSFEQAAEDLKKAVQNHKFGVLWELNFKDKLKEKGLDFDRNFKVMEVCNPAKAKEVLEQNIEVGFFLPCKMVVFEDGGAVYIGMLRPTGIIGLMGGKDLMTVAKDVENELMANGWLSVPASDVIIFDTPDEIKWRAAAMQYGIDIVTYEDVIGNA